VSVSNSSRQSGRTINSTQQGIYIAIAANPKVCRADFQAPQSRAASHVTPYSARVVEVPSDAPKQSPLLADERHGRVSLCHSVHCESRPRQRLVRRRGRDHASNPAGSRGIAQKLCHAEAMERIVAR